MKKNEKLTKEERKKIYKLTRLGYNRTKISKELGRHRTTISRELKRNLVDPKLDYIEQANLAQQQTHERRVSASRRMRLKTETIRRYTRYFIKKLITPELIAGRLTLKGHKISHEAIYQFIYEEQQDLIQHLPVAGKTRRRRTGGKKKRGLKQPPEPKKSIEQLPQESKERSEIGHLELDAVIGTKGGAAIQNKTCRKSRKMFLDKVENLESKPYADTTINRLKELPEGTIKTILEDNGSEHADFARLQQELNISVFFCHPYCASERGTVENANRTIRKFYPKGSSFDNATDEDIRRIEDYHNNRPMKIHGFLTPNEVWNHEIRKMDVFSSTYLQHV